MEITKIEVSKPILSPTRSLDEGFESDPDRISTDSELTTQTPTPTFDLLHRTDRDGVQHTQITRRNQDSSPITSIICLDGEPESDNRNGNSDDKLILPRASGKVEQQLQHHHQNQNKPDQQQQQQQQHQQQQKQIYRRVKNKAPLPPPNSSKTNSNNKNMYQTIQPRSQSVDRIRSNINDFNKSSAVSSNQNILSGRFVRVTVDPKQQYLNYFKNYKTYQNYPIAATTGSSSNRDVYHHSSNSNSSSGLLNLSNLSNNSSNMMPQYGLTIKSSTTKNYHHHQQYSHHQSLSQQQQQHQSIQPHLPVCWTQSIPRQTRK